MATTEKNTIKQTATISQQWVVMELTTGVHIGSISASAKIEMNTCRWTQRKHKILLLLFFQLFDSLREHRIMDTASEGKPINFPSK